MPESMEADYKELQGRKEEDVFVWDSNTQLYFHASSGFYHDPNAGWYYSSNDGLYYKHENGKYVPLEFDKCVADSSVDESSRIASSVHVENGYLVGEDENEFQHVITESGENSSVPPGCSNDKEPKDPQRPSAWLEDTLIELYLAGYNQQPNLASDLMMPFGADDENNKELLANGDNHVEEIEEGEWIPEEDFDPYLSIEGEFDEGHLRDEEIWQAQYGQVVESAEKTLPGIPATDLWDWKVINEPSKYGNGQVARLVGRLVRRSAKLHPSVASGGTLLKSAPICETLFHLVRVKTGQVYKLRNPRAEYLASLSAYDSSNPTKDWGFPDISNAWQKSDTKGKPKKTKRKTCCKDSANPQDQLNMTEEHGSRAYRDRAAERRNLHGGFGVGPGQKSRAVVDANESALPETASIEEAAAQALDMSFGSQSYARRILGNMGWKEGEALGRSKKGLLEPIQTLGNIGNAGLGYSCGRTKSG